MNSCIFYTAGNTAALACAAEQLKSSGCRFAEKPGPEVTHLLLPVPSLDSNGCIRGGDSLQSILQQLPENIQIFGGNLPALDGYNVYDLLQDPSYIAENGYITAHCAVRLIMDKLPTALRGCKILVIGWGRIGKCLAALLKGLEAQVSVAARKESDRAMLRALGYRAVSMDALLEDHYRVIFNTVPAMVLPESPPGCLKVDLASLPGIGGQDVIWARGLPGKDAPEASGSLIARTVLGRIRKEDTL